MKSIQQKGWWIAALCALGALMLMLNLLTPMICDDYRYAFSFATGERLTGAGQILPSLAAHGHVLNGRYAPHFFVQLFAMLPEVCFDVVNTAVFLLLVVGLCRLAGSNSVWLFAAVTGALFLLPPVFGQNMLWMAGSCNYLWPCALLVWLMRPFLKTLLDGQTKLRWFTVVLMVLGGFLFGNSSENLSAAGLLFMGLCILWLLVGRQRTPVWMWLTAAATLAGWLLLMLAPVDKPTGTAEAGMLGVLLERFSTVMGLWIKHLGVLTVAWVFLACIGWETLGKKRVAISGLLVLCALCCHLAMVVSEYVPERVLLGPIVLLMGACVLLADGLSKLSKPVYRGLCLSLCLMALLNVAASLPHTYNRYRLAEARNAQMAEAAAANTADVTTFGILGRTPYDGYTGLLELSSNPETFSNVAYAAYYGVDSVTVERVE